MNYLININRKFYYIIICIIIILIFIGIIIYNTSSKVKTIKGNIKKIDGNVVKLKISDFNEEINLLVDKDTIIEYKDEQITLELLNSINDIIKYPVNVTYKNKKIEKIEFLLLSSKIQVFLESNVTDIGIQKLISDIKLIDGVKDIVFKSKEEIKNEMSEENSSFEQIFNHLEENPLHDTLTVEVESIDKVKEISKNIEKMYNVHLVQIN